MSPLIFKISSLKKYLRLGHYLSGIDQVQLFVTVGQSGTCDIGAEEENLKIYLIEGLKKTYSTVTDFARLRG